MNMRVWLLVALMMGGNVPAWAVCTGGLVYVPPQQDGSVVDASKDATPRDGGEKTDMAADEAGDGAAGTATGTDEGMAGLAKSVALGGCFSAAQLASLPGAVPAIAAVDPEGTDVAADAAREAQQGQGGGGRTGDGGGEAAVASADRDGVVQPQAQEPAVWGNGGVDYNSAVAAARDDAVGSVVSYEPVRDNPDVAAVGTRYELDVPESEAQREPRFWSEPVANVDERVPTQAEVHEQIIARDAQDAKDGVVRVSNRMTVPDETTRRTGGLARDVVLGTLGNAAARANDSSTSVGSICARGGLACADPQTVRLAGVKSGLESGFGVGQSSVTASGRVDRGTFNHYSPERIDYLNARYYTGWTREEVYGSLDRQADFALIDTAHNLRLADSRMTNAGLTYAEAGITREQFAICINTRGETGCTVTNAINDFRITDPNIARERGVAYVPNFQRNAERHSDTVTDFLQRSGTFTGQLSGVTMAGMGLTGARPSSVAALGAVAGTTQALLSPAQQVVAQLEGRGQDNQAMRDLMALQQVQQMQQQMNQLGVRSGSTGTASTGDTTPTPTPQTYEVKVFDPGTAGTAGGAGVTPASVNTPAVPVVSPMI